MAWEGFVRTYGRNNVIREQKNDGQREKSREKKEHVTEKVTTDLPGASGSQLERGFPPVRGKGIL